MNAKVVARRDILRTLGLAGAYAVVGSSAGMAAPLEAEFPWPKAIGAKPRPQPENAQNRSCLVSPSGTQVAIAGGITKASSVYVQNATAGPFALAWAPQLPESAVYDLAWSPGEDQLAFLAISLNKSARTGDLSVYTVATGAMSVRKVLTVEEHQEGAQVQKRLDLPKRGSLAWYDERDICTVSRDNTFVLIDNETGNVNPTTQVKGDSVVGSIRRVAKRQVRFLRKRMQDDRRGLAVTLAQMTDDRLEDLAEVRTGRQEHVSQAELDPDGAHVLLHTIRDRMPWIVVYDWRSGNIVKELPSIARDEDDFHYYSPVQVAGPELILAEALLEKNWRAKVITDLAKESDTAPLVAGIDVGDMSPKVRLVSVLL